MLKKALFSSMALASFMFADYTAALEEYLANKEFDINGEFFSYDFNKNGIIEPNDWIYIALPTKEAYQLLATTPTPTNAFGFAKISLPADIKSYPDGYFVKVNYPLDEDERFSWVYITSNTYQIYKLMGATPQNTFNYLDINQDGTPDPLPNIKAQLTDNKAYFIPLNLPGSSNASSSISPDTVTSDIIHTKGYTLLAWNDLGMHCMDADYSVFSILPPYNTLQAHLIKQGSEPQKISLGVTLTYEAYPSLDGKLNSYSASKTNFWQFVQPLYKKSLSADIGLTGTPMASTKPNPMHYDTQNRWWVAEGIPITPINDDGSYNPYPLVKVSAKDANGNILAQTVTVLPVSTEMDCKACHASNSNYEDAKPNRGWVNLDDIEKDYRFNILRLHDQEHPNAVADNLNQLQEKGYNYLAEGLEATAKAGTPILCASCHKSNALPNTGIEGIPPLTQAIHSKHAMVKDPVTKTVLNDIQNTNSCYLCHPGSKTQCLRGAMGKEGISCQNCHGTMSAVGSKNRDGWFDEPNCQSCHQNGVRYKEAVTNKFTGTLREALDKRFATNEDVPFKGKSLYRYSKGHGDLTCSACHGSTHAIYPSSHLEDNLQSIAIQGHAGTIAECTSCHTQTPLTANKGPHGMHSIGNWWVEEHEDYAKNNLSNCAACHGSDFRGSELSKTFTQRTFYTEYGTKTFNAGHKVSCYDCHNGPNGGEEDDD